MSKRIWGVQCLECGKRLFSFHAHDYKTCGCPNDTMIDGGREYIISGAMNLKKTRSIYWSKQDGEYPNIVVKDRFPY